MVNEIRKELEEIAVRLHKLPEKAARFGVETEKSIRDAVLCIDEAHDAILDWC